MTSILFFLWAAFFGAVAGDMWRKRRERRHLRYSWRCEEHGVSVRSSEPGAIAMFADRHQKEFHA